MYTEQNQPGFNLILVKVLSVWCRHADVTLEQLTSVPLVKWTEILQCTNLCCQWNVNSQAAGFEWRMCLSLSFCCEKHLLVLWRGLQGRDQDVHLTKHNCQRLTGSPRCYLGRKHWSVSPAPGASGALRSPLKDFFPLQKKNQLCWILSWKMLKTFCSLFFKLRKSEVSQF